MKINKDSKKIEEILTRGVVEAIDKEHLKKKLLGGKQLRVKLGIDPTSPNIHIGRAVPLLKLKDFQELGHKIVLIFGDFTGVIGDTSDKESERPMLPEKEVKQNLKTYIEQAGKIIDIKRCEVRYNSEWLGSLNYHEIGRQADVFSVNEFIARENIKKRLDEGRRVSLREILYPLMQGYDSVAVKADVEIGGTDQRFNLLAGRQLQRYYGQEPQDIITNRLIEGLDGRKMSSSWGNVINIADSPKEQFGKIMSLKDELIMIYCETATRVSLDEVKNLPARDAKARLAKEIVSLYHGEKAALLAEKEFDRVFKEKGLPSDIPEISISGEKIDILELLVKTKLVSSKTEGRRMIEQGGVAIDDEVQKDWEAIVRIKKGAIIRVGRRKFIKII